MQPNNLTAEYEHRLPVLREAAGEIEREIRDILHGVPRIDSISARAKALDRFVEKANRLDKLGNAKYSFPFEEIQDQIGARVVVYYRSDIESAINRLVTNFHPVENKKRAEKEPSQFAYESWHLVCFVPVGIRLRHSLPVDFFELQVCTLFQHAWSEASHDLEYKPQQALDWDTKRKVAWAAAQAWGADEIFDELWKRFSQDGSDDGKPEE